MIITIDGPTASGKSSTARVLAQQLGFFYINSGLLYRGLAWIALKQVSMNELASLSSNRISTFKEQLTYEDSDGKAVLFCNENNITSLLKNPNIDKAASLLGTNQQARNIVLHWQRMLAQQHKNSIVEGRDAGTTVFPDAHYKFFLTAQAAIRAKRWLQDQRAKGIKLTIVQALKSINERDGRDAERSIAPLSVPEGALIIDNSDMNIVQTVEKIKSIINVA